MAKREIITTEDMKKRLAEERAKLENMQKVEIEGVTIYADSEEEIKEIIGKTDLLRKSFEKELKSHEEILRIWGDRWWTKGKMPEGILEAAAGDMLKATLQTWMKNGRIKFAK